MSEKDDKKNITRISATESQPKAKDATAPKTEKAEKVAETTTDTKESKDAKATKEAKASDKKAESKAEKTDKPAKPAKKIEVKEIKEKKTTDDKGRRALNQYFIIFRPFVAFHRYLHDSWIEICQVRWPSRKMTWKLTLAVLVYCVIFMIFIVVLDAIFTFLFNKLLGQ